MPLSEGIWSLSSAPPKQPLEKYYVAALQPPISPSRVRPGEKLLHISQVPCRERSFCEASTEECTDAADVCDVVAADERKRNLHSLPSLACSLASMVDSAVLADLRVWPANCDTPLLAHKFILAARAPWLLRQLRDGDNLDTGGADRSTICQMLHLLYCGALPADVGQPPAQLQALAAE